MIPFEVRAFQGEDQFADNLSFRPMRETLRLAMELCGGVPCAWVGIRRRGELVASLETNWRGDLTAAHIHGPAVRTAGGYGCSTVTELSPHGPIFAGVFAS